MEKDLEREREEAEEHKSRIESARESLYQPGGPSVIHRHEEGFKSPEEEAAAPAKVFTPPVINHRFQTAKVTGKVNTLFRRILLGAIAFFVVSLGVAGFMYFYGNNIISSRNITIDVVAPPSVPSSDTFTFDISLQNGNNSDLIKAALVIDYPDGTRYVDDNTRPLVNERIDIGTVDKGEIVKKTISARLFGEENAEKEIKIRFEYQVANSNAHFSKDSSFKVVLGLAPLIFSVDALKEVNSTQEVVLTARVISNSNNTLQNVAMNVTYPYGFNYTSSNLEVDGKDGKFPLGELVPNETKTVEIRGTINGQSAEDKVFKFNVGTANPDKVDTVATALALYVHQMTIRSDFLASAINFQNGTNHASLGAPLRGTITWRNTLSDPINDAQFKLKIGGDLIDTKNVSSDRGFFNSITGIIEYDKSGDKQLEEIAPGQSGSYSFNIPLFSYEEAVKARITNPKVNLVLDIEGLRINENDVPEMIRSSFSKMVPVITTVDLQAKTLHNSGPIKNSGPIPPKAENKTTYTIALSLANTVNEVTKGELVATLPKYVTYEGEVSPSGEKVKWSESSRQIVWDVGTVPVRAGYVSLARTVYIKVSVTPSRTQIGQELSLMDNIRFSGKDVFAGADITANGSSATIGLDDPGVGYEGNQVVE